MMVKRLSLGGLRDGNRLALQCEISGGVRLDVALYPDYDYMEDSSQKTYASDIHTDR